MPCTRQNGFEIIKKAHEAGNGCGGVSEEVVEGLEGFWRGLWRGSGGGHDDVHDDDDDAEDEDGDDEDENGDGDDD
eukprot:4413156-Karenia_brevis.AAC.1